MRTSKCRAAGNSWEDPTSCQSNDGSHQFVWESNILAWFPDSLSPPADFLPTFHLRATGCEESRDPSVGLLRNNGVKEVQTQIAGHSAVNTGASPQLQGWGFQAQPLPNREHRSFRPAGLLVGTTACHGWSKGHKALWTHPRRGGCQWLASAT